MVLLEEVAEDRDGLDLGFVTGIFRSEGAAEKRRDAKEFKGVG
jgi:hypothetical protein